MTSKVVAPVSNLCGSLESKIGSHHLRRKAIVYVRQSTQSQLKFHRESRHQQYALVHQVAQLGWSETQIEVYDEDLGQSATSIETRAGFLRMLAEVRQGQVGLVMSLDASRLCRSSLDWQRLMQVCARSASLMADQDGLYDPRQPNDRLFLGLKGVMSEFELHLLQLRMDEGKRAKAARGELALVPPRGYVRGPEGRLEKDPDEQVREVIEMVFAQFVRLGSVRSLLRWMLRHQLKLPRRSRSGPLKGQLKWSEPTPATLRNLLRSPLYSGQYVFGRDKRAPNEELPGGPPGSRRLLPPEHWQVCKANHHPAYITVQQYRRNCQQLARNRPQGLGAAREGPALAAGLLRCGRCSAKMVVSYKNNGGGLRYDCIGPGMSQGKPLCQSLVGKPVERALEALVLAALKPAALELSVAALEELEEQRAQLHRHWQQRLERAAYKVQQAQSCYEAVDPRNRLVAATLERRWEETLAEEQQLQRQYHSFSTQQPAKLTQALRRQILALAGDLPGLWHAPTTSARQRQQMVRLLIEEVELCIQGRSEKVRVVVHWAGAEPTVLELRRPVARLEQLSFYPKMLQRLGALHQQGLSDRLIASHLNKEGFHSAYGKALSPASIAELRRRVGLSRGSRCSR